MKKKLFLCFLVLLIVLIVPVMTYAHSDENEHNEELERVIFEPDYMRNATYSQKEKVKAIEKALALVTDQQGDNGQPKLDYLNGLGVKGIAKDVSEICVSYHRYSHKGWNYAYLDSEVPWKTRSKVLKATVNHIVKFNGASNELTNYCPECDSLSALLYYVHITGDHEVQKTWSAANNIIPLGGKANKEDVIDEILKHSEVLFESQTNSREYKSYVKRLNKLNKKVKKLYDSSNKMDDTVKVKMLNEYSEDLLNIIMKYVPELLKNETYFYNTFYL